MRISKTALLAILGLLCSAFAFSQSLDLSPEPDGTINVAASLGWEYSGGWSGSAQLRTGNNAAVDETSSGTSLEQSLTTIHKQVSAELVPLAFKAGDFDLRLSIKGDYLNIRETGFIDFRQNGGAVDPIIRLFFNNLRSIYAVKPGLSVGWGAKGDAASLSLNLSYSPWVWLALDQTLSTASDGTAFDTPKAKHDWQGSSLNSFGSTLDGSLDLDFLSIDLASSLEGTLYRYEFLQIGGSIGSQAAWILDGNADLFLSIPGVRITGLIPRFGMGWGWTGTFDQAAGAKPDMLIKLRLSLGFRGRN